MPDKAKVTLYTDGACSGNPGPGGYGAILVYIDQNGVKHEKEFSGGYKYVTNNQMELLAVIVGFEALKKPADVTIVSDSKYVCDAFNQKWIDGWVKKNWKNVKNVELWQRLLKAMQGHDSKFEWVKGHAGHPYNERCDSLGVNAYKQKKLADKI